jgi:hypothetical protein
VLLGKELALRIAEAVPVTSSHRLVIQREHVASWTCLPLIPPADATLRIQYPPVSTA